MKNRVVLKCWNWWKNHTIREQVFLSMLFVSLLSIGVLGFSAYRMSRRTIEGNYQKAHVLTLKNSSRVMDLTLKPIVDKSREILNDPELKGLMSGDREYDRQEFRLTDQRELEQILSTIMTQEKSVHSAGLFDLRGHYYFSSNISRGTYEIYNYYREHDYMADSWIAKTEAANGREVFWGHGVLGGIDRDDVVSFTKLLRDPSGGEPIGLLVINLSRGLLRSSFVEEDEGYSTSHYMIIDPGNGNEVIYGDDDDTDYSEIMRERSEGAADAKYIFATADNEVTGWQLMNVVNRNELSITSRNIRNIVLIGGLLLAMLSFALAYIISRTITRPLQKLADTIHSVGKGARQIDTEFDNSEVGQIGSKFKEMVNTNLDLSERLMAARLNEREGELRLLQSQINPHFLYNTLDSIYCVAIIHGDDEIAEMVLALSENFKLSLNKGERFVTVTDEVKRIEGYMKLQNIRYHDRFKLFVDVKRDILQCKIVSFILQPFVENAMYHGLEPKVGPGTIKLLGWHEVNNVVIEISDDGVGIADMDVLEKGYGIRNVRERIELNYGAGYGVTVTSKVNVGTTVRIVVPDNPRRSVICID